MGVVDEDVVDVVLEDCRLAGGRRGLVAGFGGEKWVVARLLDCRKVASGEDVQQ